VSGLFSLALAAMLLAQAAWGLAETLPAAVVAVLMLVIWIFFYAMVRCGASRRFSDPAMAAPQMAAGVVLASLVYVISGPVRGVSLAIITMVVAYAMVSLPSRTARHIAVFALVVLALAMTARAWVGDEAYLPVVEVSHWIGVALSAAALWSVSAQMSGLRNRLRKQREDLHAAQKQVRVLSTQDELTGLPNRRHMNSLMTIEKSRQQRNGRVLSLVLIDIDFFQRINDTYGDTGGDLVLKTFAQFSRASLRPSDTLARWGGEEFLLMLPETSAHDAMLCVERMRTHFARMSADAIAPGLHVTFSAGVSGSQSDDDVDGAVLRASQALQRAKEQGRNCAALG